MAARPPTRQSNGRKPKDRRATEGSAAPLRKLKGLLGRPIGVERRDGKLQIVLTERRRAKAEAGPDDNPWTPARLCAELSDRLLAHEADQTARTMRQLVYVHDLLERKGWPGVASMAGRVLAEAIGQLEMLASEYPSPLLDHLIEQLKPLQAAAMLRDERDSRLQDFDVGETLTVRESDFAEFEDAERSWSGTVPVGLGRPEHED